MLGIQLGMSAEEARTKLKAAAGDLNIVEAQANRADGTGRYLWALSLFRTYAGTASDPRAFGAARRGTLMREAVQVVLSELDGMVVEVVRHEFFPEGARPAMDKVNDAMEAAYGARLAGGSLRYLRDPQGRPTEDRQCAQAVAPNPVVSTVFADDARIHPSSVSYPNAFFPQCGRLFSVLATSERDGAIVTSLMQRLVDTQAVLRNQAHQRLAAQAAAEKRRQEELSRELGRATGQPAPRL